ncbi:hypothetical protein C8J57DRAFT_1304513 [Mycena rebaudengoi]|nr:hypothetical protein C8J57DRAFT_1304513 [Mycena rebaudengoi]
MQRAPRTQATQKALRTRPRDDIGWASTSVVGGVGPGSSVLLYGPVRVAEPQCADLRRVPVSLFPSSLPLPSPPLPPSLALLTCFVLLFVGDSVARLSGHVPIHFVVPWLVQSVDGDCGSIQPPPLGGPDARRGTLIDVHYLVCSLGGCPVWVPVEATHSR